MISCVPITHFILRRIFEQGKTVGIKLKLTTFEVRVRAKTLPYHIHKACDIARYAKEVMFYYQWNVRVYVLMVWYIHSY